MAGPRLKNTLFIPLQVVVVFCSLRELTQLPSQLCFLGSSRARGHPCLCLLRWKDFRPHFQKLVTLRNTLYFSTYRWLHTDDGQWGADIFNGHAIGCNAVSWAPATIPGSLITPTSGANLQPGQALNTPQSIKRFATAGCDNLVKIWGYREDTQSWVEEEILEGHTDWVRDVAWAPNIGLPRSYIATASQVGTEPLRSLSPNLMLCSQDKTVVIWTKDTPTSPWVKTTLDPSVSAVSAPASAGTPGVKGKFPDVVWRVSWSLAGNILAVSCGDGKVTLWKENLKGSWECVSDMTS